MREVVAELKALRLHGMAQRYEELLAEPGSGIQSAGWLMQCLLEAEVTDRHVRSIRYQMGAAKFPVHRDLAGFDFGKSRVDEKLIGQLATAEFTDAAANVVFIGGTGTGKTHLATALGVKAITQHSKRVRFFSTVDLVNSLEQEKAAGETRSARLQPDARRLDRPRRTGLSAVQPSWRRAAVPPALEALRAHQRDHHDEPHLRRVAGGVWRRQVDDRAARSSDPPLPHRRNGQRVVPLPAEQPDGEGEGQSA